MEASTSALALAAFLAAPPGLPLILLDALRRAQVNEGGADDAAPLVPIARGLAFSSLPPTAPLGCATSETYSGALARQRYTPPHGATGKRRYSASLVLSGAPRR